MQINIIITDSHQQKMNQIQLKQLSPQILKKNRQSTFFQTFSSSVLGKSAQKFTLDKTLVKGIKQNDPSKIVENGEQADLGNTSALYDEEKQVNGLLVNMRKKYDQAKQNTTTIQQTIERMKKEKQNLEYEKQKMQSLFRNEQKELKNIQIDLQKLNSMCQSAQYTKEVRVQMGEILKQDLLFYKKNCFEANIKIVRNHNKLKTLTGQLQSSRKVTTNCRSLVYSIDKKIGQKQNERTEKINTYYEILNKKMDNNDKRQERQRMIENSTLEALYGKMPEEQQQKKVLLVNLTLKKLLKMKMERQMERFNSVSSAFRNIQQNTSIKKADEFVQKFIQRQKTYGELLESISKNQEKINRLKHQKEKLQKQNHQILYEKQTIEDIQLEKNGQNPNNQLTSIELLRERLLHNEKLKNKSFSFITKFLSAFNNENIEDVKKIFSRQKPHLSLKEVLSKVSRYLESLQKQVMESKLKEIEIQSASLSLPFGAKTRNLRIKTLTTRGDSQHSAMQDQDIAYDDLSERQFLNYNRKQIKKSAYLRNRLRTKAC